MLMTPPKALTPYRTEIGPRMISILSIRSSGKNPR